jgi:hypothetical protein
VRTGLEVAAEEGDALAHADEAVAPFAFARASDPVVSHLECEQVLACADPNPRACRTGMLEHVRERLLHDPVDGELQRRRQALAAVFHVQVDGHSGRAHIGGEPVEVGDARLRRDGAVAAVVAEDA